MVFLFKLFRVIFCYDFIFICLCCFFVSSERVPPPYLMSRLNIEEGVVQQSKSYISILIGNRAFIGTSCFGLGEAKLFSRFFVFLRFAFLDFGFSVCNSRRGYAFK